MTTSIRKATHAYSCFGAMAKVIEKVAHYCTIPTRFCIEN